MELTPAGDALARSARRLLHEAEHRRFTRRVKWQGRARRLRIDVGSGAADTPRLVLERLAVEHPELVVTRSENPSRMAISMLATDVIDAAFNFALDHPAVEHEPVRLEPSVMMIPAEHALARRDRVDVSELRGETFIRAPDHLAPEWNATFDPYYHAIERGPRFAQRTVDRVDRVDELVRDGAGLTLVHACIAAAVLDGVAFIRVTPPPPSSPWALNWRREEGQAEPIATLRQVVSELRRERGWLEDPLSDRAGAACSRRSIGRGCDAVVTPSFSSTRSVRSVRRAGGRRAPLSQPLPRVS